jgi:hypothetical protein
MGHKHYLQTTHDGKLRIGCYIHTFEEWEAPGMAEQIGKENGYDALAIEIYKLHIAHAARISRLLWKAERD